MKTIFTRLTYRMGALLGLDFEIDLQDDFISKLRSDLYLGARPGPDKVEFLKKEGITHIVSCLEADKQGKVSFLDKDFETLFLPIKDGVEENVSSALAAFLEFVSNSQAQTANAKFLVHCEVGVSRSATLVLGLLMKREQKRFFDVFNEIRLIRAKILPNIGFASQLQQFEHVLLSANPASNRFSSLASYLHQICNVPEEIELLQATLERYDYHALNAIRAIFGEDIPRVIQGVRV